MSHSDSQGFPILLIDLECTCNDVPPIPSSEMEIIEIGAVVGMLSQKEFEIFDERQVYENHNNGSANFYCTSGVFRGLNAFNDEWAIPLFSQVGSSQMMLRSN